VGEQLTDAGVDWAYYSAVPGQPGYFWNAYNGIANVFHTDLWHEHVRAVDGILDDIKANALPAVTWVTPRFQLSDHPPFSTGHAHNWVTKIVNEVMRSDMWEHTAIFLTWDEWGGFYDPIVPPAVDHIGLGIRVPLLTISPYTRRGVIDDELGEFSTPLRFISDNWGLDPLTDRIRDTQPRARLRLRRQTKGSQDHAGTSADLRDAVGLPGGYLHGLGAGNGSGEGRALDPRNDRRS
jgi:phospholipase C